MRGSSVQTLVALKEPIDKHRQTLVLCGSKQIFDSTSGKLIKQIRTKDQNKAIYQVKQIVQFKKDNIMWSIEVECKQDKDNRIVISKEVLESKMKEVNQIREREAQLARQEFQTFPIFQQSLFRQKQEQSAKKQKQREKQRERERERERQRQRERQREKERQKEREREREKERFQTPSVRRSKRREDIVNSQLMMEQENHQSSVKIFQESEEQLSLKRGKGRPKGSKNKIRRDKEPASLSEMKNDLEKRWEYGEYETPKSKEMYTPKREVKIQDDLKLIQQVFSRQKRPKGRPKGAKNKLKSEAENDENSESDENEEYNIPLQINSNVQSLPCCFQCSNRKFKQSLISSPLSTYKKILAASTSSPLNLWQDISSEKRSNVIIHSLKKNIDGASFQLLLEKLTLFEPYFIPSWEYEGRIQQLSYLVKTNKHFLSQTGKEGNYAFLHDCNVKPGVWWKQIGVKRILESLNVDTNKKIIDILKAHDAQLAKQIESNIPTLIRCGNYEIAKYLLNSMPSNAKYSKQHIEALEQSNFISQFKKSTLVKPNLGTNFLSPIHVLAVNPNPQFLQSALKILKQYNVNDSLSRKPIHYAAVAKLTTNMEILVNYQSDLKQTDKNRMTPLMLAAMFGKAKNVAYIIQRVPEPLYLNFRCKDGLSALHYAIINEQVECVNILLSSNLADVGLQTRDKLTPLHLAAGIGNIQIVKLLLEYKHAVDSVDRYKRTPLFFSIRNNNHLASYELLKQGAKYYKKDSSMNSLLHYCSAYGNTLFLQHLLPHVKLNKNRDRFYPWEISVGKGHIGCMKLLERQERMMNDGFPDYNMCFLNMTKIRYTPESMEIMNLLIDQHYKVEDVDIHGSRLLHILCSIKESEYVKNRHTETGRWGRKYERIFKEEYEKLQRELISKLESKGSCIDVENKHEQTAVSLCIERENMSGLRLLLKDRLNLKFQSSRGYTILHYLSRLASQSVQGIKFTLSKFQVKENKRDEERNKLRDALKRVDKNGFEPILFFVRDFTSNVKNNFNRKVKALKEKGGIEASNAEGIVFQEYKEHETYFVKLIELMVDLGCDANVVVASEGNPENNEKALWGIQHFLMKFPSLVLLQFFKNKIKIRDFNSFTSNKSTPLHLFCQWNKYGCLFETDLGGDHRNYRGEEALEFLLKNGCNTNSLDMNKSNALLYAALNKQVEFIFLLRKAGASINTLNMNNQVPFIEIIKMKSHFTYAQIQEILKIGADPNFEDMHKETALHHLVYNSVNLDNSVDLCKLFFTYGAKINSLDQFQRTPLFYCFTNINEGDSSESVHDKVEILQVLLKQPGIDINHRDVYRKTALHYACERNYFFSIIQLLDKKIEFNVKDINGNTPLALCMLNKTLNQAAMLIRKGVTDGSVTDSDHKKMSYFNYCATKLPLGLCFMLLDYGYPVDKALQETTNPLVKAQLEKKYGRRK